MKKDTYFYILKEFWGDMYCLINGSAYKNSREKENFLVEKALVVTEKILNRHTLERKEKNELREKLLLVNITQFLTYSHG